jgi:hypothetical protein
MRIGDVLKILHKKVEIILSPAAVLLFAFMGTVYPGFYRAPFTGVTKLSKPAYCRQKLAANIG